MDTYHNMFHEANARHKMFGRCLILAVLLTVGGCIASYAQDVDMSKIAIIESSGNSKAVGDNGQAFGLYQIHKAVVTDYNANKGQNLRHSDMFNPVLAHKVADYYINTLIPRYLRHYGLADTVENRLTAYNMGIKAVKQGKLAKAYIKKYKSY